MPDGEHFNGTLILECPKCSHRWLEHLDLPMRITPVLARMRAWQVCPNCENKRGTLMLTGDRFRQAYEELAKGGTSDESDLTLH